MEQFGFDYSKKSINISALIGIYSQIIPEIKKITQELSKGYNTPYAALNLPNDIENLKNIQEVATSYINLRPSLLILIGIGGSNLGTLAVFEALYGKLYNSIAPDIKFYCADTIDNDMLSDLLDLTENELKQNRTVIITIVTKSGTTTETLINSALFINLIKKYHPHNYYNYIVTITDKDSPLWLIAEKERYQILEIPKLVGGRYSVLSAVGLFPLAVLGISIDKLISGARDMLKICTSEKVDENFAALSAAITYKFFLQSINIHDTFIFSPDLAMLGAWYRQLVGESLGKSHDLCGNLVETGITPTVSIGTADLHSVAQLYLGGPRDKITTFVHFCIESNKLIIPDEHVIKPISKLANKSVTYVKNIIFNAVTKAYEIEKRPFMIITLSGKNAYSLGQFIMMKMCEIIYLGSLLKVNVFDQPAVEIYKQESRRALEHE